MKPAVREIQTKAKGGGDEVKQKFHIVTYHVHMVPKRADSALLVILHCFFLL